MRDQRWHASIATSDADDVLAPVVHSSPLGGFSDETADRQTMEGQLLALLIRRHAGCDDVQVVTAYPNLGLKAEHGARVAVLHHGHFVEGAYRIISTFKGVLFPDHEPPTEVHGWEAENHAWIDFVWGTLGQSGKAGVDITRVYEMLAREDSLELLVERAANALAHDSGPHTDFLHKTGGWFARTVGGHIVQAIHDRERHQVKVALSKKGWEGLNEYVDGPVRLQLAADPDPGFHVHDDLVFIFGHTHKPFEEMRLPEPVGQSVEVVNTGGWVVDSVADDSVQGAAVVLLDGELNAVSLRCYHEGSSNDEGVRVSGAQPSAFRDRIQDLVHANDQVWRTLSAAALKAVDERHKDLSIRVTEDMSGEDEPEPQVAQATGRN